MTVLASFPHQAWAFVLLILWLVGAITASYLSDRKGYGERPGLASGLLLTILAPVVWLFVPAREDSRYKNHGMFGRPDPSAAAPEPVARPDAPSPPMGRASSDEAHTTAHETAATTTRDTTEPGHGAAPAPALPTTPATPATPESPSAPPTAPPAGSPEGPESPKALADQAAATPGPLLIGDPSRPAGAEDLPTVDSGGELALSPGEDLLDAFTADVDARAHRSGTYEQLWRFAHEPLVRVTSTRVVWIGGSSLWRADGGQPGEVNAGQLRFAWVTGVACYPGSRTRDGKARIAFSATGHDGVALRVAVTVEDGDSRRLFERWANAVTAARGGGTAQIEERKGALHASV